MTMTQFSIRAGSAFLALSASLVTLTAPDAADLPPIYETPLFERAPELQPVEIGTGWYLRGDVGYAFSSDENHSINRRYLVGEGYSVGTVDESIEGKLSVGAGIGYRINDWLRADATAEWLGSADVESSKGTPCDVTLRIADANAPSGYVYVPREDTCSEKSVLDTDVYNYMVNAYADLGTVVGFTPYIGAGLGVANVQSTVKADRLCNERQNFDIACPRSADLSEFGVSHTQKLEDHDDSTWQLSYSLMAGVGYQATKNLTVDVGYRYLAVPEYTAFGKTFDDGFDIHQIRAGVRYSLW